jgi:peptidoglycan/xylan/chitin deacetylase (PgdA/CDA1 family)
MQYQGCLIAAWGKELIYWMSTLFRKIFKGLATSFLPDRFLITRLPRDSQAVALTFDDGPHPDYTPRVLEVLDNNGIKATFFMVGDRVVQYPSVAREVALRGHAVGNHTMTHVALTDLARSDQIKEIREAQNVIEGETGVRPSLFRPPWGRLDFRIALSIWKQGLTIVLWSVDWRDSSVPSSEELVLEARRRPLSTGDIAVLHDGVAKTAKALENIIIYSNLKFIKVKRSEVPE